MKKKTKKSEGRNAFHEDNALKWWNKLILQEQTIKMVRCGMIDPRKTVQDLNIKEICTIFEYSIFDPNR